MPIADAERYAGFADDAALIETAVREAGELARRHFEAPGGVRKWRKHDGSDVSEADLAVDRLLRQRLLAARPDYGWLSEETADDPSRLEKERVFIVDPIDGTMAFLGGSSQWVVSVALALRGEAVIGCVYNPVRELFYFAAAGRGATCNGRPLQVAGRSELAGATLATSPGRKHDRQWSSDWPQAHKFPVNSIAYRLAVVAAGEADALMSLSSYNEWDLAAAAVVVREAGGRVTTHSGEPLVFNQPAGRRATLIAANPVLHAQLLAHTRHVAAEGRKSASS